MKTLLVVCLLAAGALANVPLSLKERIDFMRSIAISGQNQNQNRNNQEHVVFASGTECMLCKTVYQLVASLLQSEEPQIQQKVDQLCQSLGPLASVCTGLVNQYLPTIIQSIQSGKDETEVCVQLLKLCTSINVEKEARERQKIVKIQPLFAPVAQVSSNGFECTICQVLYKVIASMAQADQQQIINACDDACDDLGPLASTCKSLVAQYVPQMIQAIQSGQDMDEVCGSLLGLCTSAVKPAIFNMPVLMHTHESAPVKAVVPKRVPIQKFNFITCEICKFAVDELEKAVAAHDQTILNDLEKVCDVVPVSSWKSECVSLVTKYGAELLKAIMDGAGDKACELVTLC